MNTLLICNPIKILKSKATDMEDSISTKIEVVKASESLDEKNKEGVFQVLGHQENYNHTRLQCYSIRLNAIIGCGGKHNGLMLIMQQMIKKGSVTDS